MGRPPREAVLGGALVLCALVTLLVPAIGAFAAATVGILAHRAGFERLAGFAITVSVLGLALVALVSL
jgi:hypothetical protein